MESTAPILHPEFELPSGEATEIVAPKIADTKHQISAPKKGLKFYWREVRLIVLSLVILEFLSSIFSAGKTTANFGNEILSPFSFLAQIIAFVFLSAKFLKEKSVKRSFFVPLFCAFLSGLALAIIQLVWHHRVWTLYNLAFEPIWWLARALVISIFINIIYKIYQLLTYKKGIEATLKIN
jgi:hypothetical protein